MEYTDEHFYMLALSFVEELTAYQKIKLLEEKGSAEAIFLDRGAGRLYSRVSHQQFQNAIKKADKECELIAKNNIETLFVDNIKFPFRLRNCPDYPLALFYKGKLDPNRKFALSIVGTRKADDRGEQHVQELLEALAPYKSQLVIVSGIASGIDAMVLRHAKRLGIYTICVLPQGFGHRYDSRTNKIIQLASCVVTENKIQYSYSDKIYDQRNRIIVGMTDAVVVAQAKNGNGAGLYIGKAIDYNRDSFAFVYPNESPENEKCNLFVDMDEAMPLFSTEDFFEKMVWPWF